MQQADLGAGIIMTAPDRHHESLTTGPHPTIGNGIHNSIHINSNSNSNNNPLPKCFCNWKHCRTYQKAFREFKHPLFNGVIKLKFVKTDRKSIALKATVDRTLHVDSVRRNEWREPTEDVGVGGGVDVASSGNAQCCRYYVARHHFTEALIKHYLSDRRGWDWNEPLTMKQAKNFLWSLDRQDVYHSEDEAENDEEDDDVPTRYVQAPNVPKDQVREMLKKLKEESKKQQQAAASSNQLPPIPPQSSSKAGGGKKSSGYNNNGTASTHTQSTLSTAITDSLKAFEEDIVRPAGGSGTGGGGGAGTGTVSLSGSNREEDSALAEKEEENNRLRTELADCQEQLSMLHNMVKQLKVDMDRTNRGSGSGGGGAPAAKTSKSSKKKKQQVKQESSSEDEEDDDDDENDEESSSEDEEDEEDEQDWSNGPGRPQESEDEETISTYHVNGMSGSQSRSGHSRPGSRHSNRKGSIHSRRSVRRDSVHSRRDSIHSRSRHSVRRDSVHSRRSMRGGVDDGASVVSRQSLQSVSPSIKSLPREIELMDDEEDTQGKDDYSFFDDSYRKPDDDARSVGSRSAASRASRRSMVSGTRSRGRNSRRPGTGSTNKKKPSSGSSNGNGGGGAGGGGGGSGGGGGRGSSAVPREIDLSGDEVEPDGTSTHVNVSTDTLFVRDKQIVDPYGEKGVYTGALSKSTCMPNGEGRLEYEKEGRWYEGDWIHGRWTGYGRLSNGDGDFYEGGLKNDHKHGTGIMRFADGRVFEGKYIRGQMIEGKMTYQDGSVYGGSWVDGMRHGRGKCIFVDGSEYEGEFREGNFHGKGKMTWNDGGWYVGEWCDGEMHGRGKEIRPDGSLRHDGEWSRGQPIRSASDARRRRQQQPPVAGIEAN